MNTEKGDKAPPRGVFRHSSGEWAIRYFCGLGCKHEEKIGNKTEAKNAHAARRLRVRQDPAWCPKTERREARARAERQAAERVTVRQYAAKWLAGNRDHWRPLTLEG